MFQRDGILYRQVNTCYAEHFDALIDSGLYRKLIDKNLMVAHEVVPIEPAGPGAHCIIKPRRIGFISYPYEWSFSQYRDAALLTLRVQQLALEHGMVLKDASAYNVQFENGRPIFIDTLSFERYVEGEPWIAYGQFVQHFLGPLALMSRRDVRLSSLMRTHIGGLPLDMTAELLPHRTMLHFGLLMHVHLLARSQRRHADDAGAEGKAVAARKVSKHALLAIVQSLQNTVKSLRWTPAASEWGDYYDATNYSDAAMKHKHELVATFIDQLGTLPGLVWDLGANTGSFSRIASQRGCNTIAFDLDPAAVEKNYLHIKKQKEQNLLPLVMDLTNPSPGIGWRNCERDSLLSRGPADLVLALALVHHLAIGNNVPLGDLAAFFADCGPHLIVEYVPKSDSQVKRLLATRRDIFPHYTQDGFEAAFALHFEVLQRQPIAESQRVLYLMKKR
ncbi:MAG: SAM-dependent methyltransferase [Phycisphaeraceae bacterium]|nr:SAM-dependent methyltransferase [Phycisphaeraceae bacterium]